MSIIQVSIEEAFLPNFSGSGTASSANATDIQTFQDSYHEQTNEVQATPPSEGFTFVEKISNSVSSVSDNLKIKFDSISKLAHQDTSVINTNQLLKIQLELSQLSLETQLFGDMVSKATKNLDQLTHLQ